MKKILLGLLFPLFCLSVKAQTLSAPILWVKADSAVLGAATWQDISGHGRHITPQSGALPDNFARLNFNKAFAVDGDCFTANGLPFAARDMAGMVVYRLANGADEQGIWEISAKKQKTENAMTENVMNDPAKKDFLRVGLTSQKLLGERGDIRYRDTNEHITFVHTLFRNWKWSVGLPDSYEFQLLRADSLPFHGRIAECLLFDWHINDTTLVQYISYLALKYGITLYKTNYLNSSRQNIWDYSHNPDFSYSIAGLGRDDKLGLYQKQSYMMDEKIVIGLREMAPVNEANRETLENGEYLIWGFDSSLLSKNGMIYLDNGDEFEVYGNGLLQSHNAPATPRATFMTVNGSGWEGAIENYYLLIDRSGTGEFKANDLAFYVPDFVDSANVLHFSNIEWDTDNNGIDRFCFTYVPVDSILRNKNLVANGGDNSGQSGQSGKNNSGRNGMHKNSSDAGKNGAGANSSTGVNANLYRLYPNPSNGDFVLEANYGEFSDIRVRLFTPDGKLLQTRNDKGKKQYRFDYHLSVSGEYLLEIHGGGETKTLKVSVVVR